ncbi:MAG: 8-amino-7-oxononanoate synthase [Nitrospirota bacterium]
MFEEELNIFQEQHLLRTQVTIGSAQGPRVMVNGRDAVLLCSNNYLGLAEHPALKQAACSALERFGVGSGASRLVSGTMELHEELERRIAVFKGTDAAMVFNSGYAANTGCIPALAVEGDVILSDSLNHASIIDGCRLSRACTEVFRHRDLDNVESLLKKHRSSRRKLIVTDGVFSMDGDIAPLPGLVDLAERYDATVMVDDAHATGVLGARGRGTAEHFGLTAGSVPVQMGTLGKALGSFGAYIAGDRQMVRYLMNTCRSYIFSTSLPPAVCAASIAALDLVDAEPWRLRKLRENHGHFKSGLASCGIAVGGSETPIVPVIAHSAEKALEAAKVLLDHGVFASAIRPPSVPSGSSRIRATVMASHSAADLDLAIEAFGRAAEEGCFSR